MGNQVDQLILGCILDATEHITKICKGIKISDHKQLRPDLNSAAQATYFGLQGSYLQEPADWNLLYHGLRLDPHHS